MLSPLTPSRTQTFANTPRTAIASLAKQTAPSVMELPPSLSFGAADSPKKRKPLLSGFLAAVMALMPLSAGCVKTDPQEQARIERVQTELEQAPLLGTLDGRINGYGSTSLQVKKASDGLHLLGRLNGYSSTNVRIAEIADGWQISGRLNGSSSTDTIIRKNGAGWKITGRMNGYSSNNLDIMPLANGGLKVVGHFNGYSSNDMTLTTTGNGWNIAGKWNGYSSTNLNVSRTADGWSLSGRHNGYGSTVLNFKTADDSLKKEPLQLVLAFLMLEADDADVD